MTNLDQAAHWNAAAGRNWVEMQPVLDRMFSGLLPPLLDAVTPEKPARILDIGCGAGALTLAAAARAGADAECLGIDISAPLVAAARSRAISARAGNVAFDEADAQTHPLEPGSFDVVLSRFGVMFFDDPVAAFGNLRRASRPSGALRFAAWRSPVENPFMTATRRAALPFLDLPATDPKAPGQFAFAERERVQDILAASGWREVSIEPLDATCVLAAADLPDFARRLGVLGPLWPDLAPDLQALLEEPLREAFSPFVTGREARFTAACWLVNASA